MPVWNDLFIACVMGLLSKEIFILIMWLISHRDRD